MNKQTKLTLLLTALRKGRSISEATYNAAITIITEGGAVEVATLIREDYLLYEPDGVDKEVPLSLTEKGAKLLEIELKDRNLDKSCPGQNVFDLANINKSEARKLGFAILDHELHKRWGSSLNKKFYSVMEETKNYYREHLHPTTKINAYKEDISKAYSSYNAALIDACEVIVSFKPDRPVKVFKDLKSGVEMFLVNIDALGKWHFKSDGSIVVGSQFMFNIPSNVKENILKSYYKQKSQNKNDKKPKK